MRQDELLLTDQVAVVTGASAGVGRAIVRAFAAEGARVALIARNPDGLEAAAHEVRELGSEALVLPLMAWGIGPGDAVFCPSFTFAATAEAMPLVGASPVFVDIDPETYNLDPESLEAAIAAVKAEGKLTPRAVIAVDLFGGPADYPAIAAVCAAPLALAVAG